MSDANLLLEKDAAVATITFNNPKALNALTEETFTGMEALLDELENDAEIRVIILTGAGDKAFIAGGDISHLATLDADGARHFALLAQRVIDRIETFPKPVIAAINGAAIGGGVAERHILPLKFPRITIKLNVGRCFEFLKFRSKSGISLGGHWSFHSRAEYPGGL